MHEFELYSKNTTLLRDSSIDRDAFHAHATHIFTLSYMQWTAYEDWSFGWDELKPLSRKGQNFLSLVRAIVEFGKSHS
jgi:hypothetical protein